MTNLCYIRENKRENPCPACKGSGFEYRWMVRRECHVCEGTKKNRDVILVNDPVLVDEIVSAPELENQFETVIKRRGRPKRILESSS